MYQVLTKKEGTKVRTMRLSESSENFTRSEGVCPVWDRPPLTVRGEYVAYYPIESSKSGPFVRNQDKQEKRCRAETAPLPLDRRLPLTFREAAAYSSVGINKMDGLPRQRNCPFVLFVGTKKRVKRKEFEAFFRDACAI